MNEVGGKEREEIGPRNFWKGETNGVGRTFYKIGLDFGSIWIGIGPFRNSWTIFQRQSKLGETNLEKLQKYIIYLSIILCSPIS